MTELTVRDITRKEQYHHPMWKKFRNAVFERDGHECTRCSTETGPFHAHHVRYNKNKLIWEVPMEWVVTLCVNCHSLAHGRNLTGKKNKPKVSVFDFF